MEDAQSPPEDENDKADHARRTGLRLRDAEAVASTRLDMFGDGSLLDTLAAEPAPPAEEQRSPDAVAAPEPAEALEAMPSEMQREPGLDETVHPGAAGLQADPDHAPDAGQPLDAIIDSFAAEPASGDTERPPVEPPDDPILLDWSHSDLIEGSSADADLASSGQPQDDTAERFHVSAIFEGLGAAEPHGEPDVEQDKPGAEDFRAEMIDREESADSPGAAVQDEGGPDLIEQAAFSPELAMLPPAPPAAAPEASAEEPAAPDLSGADFQDMDEPSSAVQPPTPREGVDAPFPEPAGWPPPFPEPPGGVPTGGSDRAPWEPPFLGGPAVSGGGTSASPFPAPPAWPPFLEPPGAASGRSAQKPSGLPPYIELPANPQSGAKPAEPRDMPSFSEAPAAVAYPPDPPRAFFESAAEDVPPFPISRTRPPFSPEDADTAPPYAEPPTTPAPPRLAEAPRFSYDEAPQPAVDAAKAKIAAQASATAQALDNLQHLLTRTTAPPAPPPQQQRPTVRQRTRPARTPHPRLPDDVAPFPHGEPAPIMPLPRPLPEPEGGKSIYLLGFLTGLALSLMAGGALYLLLTTGG